MSRVPNLPSNPVLEELPAYFTQQLIDALDTATLIDFSVGDPDEPTPEFVRQALIDGVTPVSSYPRAAGHARLRTAIAQWVARRHGVQVDPDTQVLATAGSKEAIFHLPLVVLDAAGPRSGVVWGEPGYPVYDRGTRFAGGRSLPVQLGPQGGWRLELSELDTAQLDHLCLAWLNYPHNPTGATADLEYFRRQVATARAHGFVLASDECYQEIWFDQPAPSVLEACDGDLTGVIAAVSLSKRSGMTGYRSGALIGDATLIARLRQLRMTTGTASPGFVQDAATAAWSDQAHVDERREIFAAKREVLLDFFAHNDIEVSGSQATFYLWFGAPDGDDVGYARALMEAGILATPGRSFGPGGAGWLRLALVPTVTECVTAVRQWQEAISQGRLPH